MANDSIDKLVPGFRLLLNEDLSFSENLKDFQTNESPHLIGLILQYADLLSSTDGCSFFASIFHDNTLDIVSYREAIQRHADFDKLKKLILLEILKKYYPEFGFVDAQDQALLVDHPSTLAFYHYHFLANHPEPGCRQALQSALRNDPFPAMVELRARMEINRARLIEDTRKKIGFLFQVDPDANPGMRNAEKIRLLNQAKREYFAKMAEIGLYFNEDEELEVALHRCAMGLYFSEMTLEMKAKLLSHTLSHYLTIHCIPATEQGLNLDDPDSRDSLSVIYEKLKDVIPVENAQTFIQEMADVHFYYQLWGLNSGGDIHVRAQSSALGTGAETDFLNFYNYCRFRRGISSFNNLLLSLSKPLQSFFDEYMDLSRYEKNTILYLIRAIMPIIIMTCFVAFAYSLMAPFAMHVVIEFIMLIPTLYLGVIVASHYVDLKRWLYEQYLIYQYGNKYEQPAYQINARLLSGFANNQNMAQEVCDYYVNYFKASDAIIHALSRMHDTGSLSSEQIEYLKDRLKHAGRLKLEWFDIHDNEQLGTEKIKDIVVKSMKKDKETMHHQLKTDSEALIDRFISSLDKHLKTCKNTENHPEKLQRQKYHLEMRWSKFNPDKSTQHLMQKCQSSIQRRHSIHQLETSLHDEHENYLNIGL